PASSVVDSSCVSPESGAGPPLCVGREVRTQSLVASNLVQVFQEACRHGVFERIILRNGDVYEICELPELSFGEARSIKVLRERDEHEMKRGGAVALCRGKLARVAVFDKGREQFSQSVPQISWCARTRGRRQDFTPVRNPPARSAAARPAE